MIENPQRELDVDELIIEYYRTNKLDFPEDPEAAMNGVIMEVPAIGEAILNGQMPDWSAIRTELEA